MASPYDVLQVDPDADEREIDRAYRRRVMETHPDQGGSAREFQVVKSAYERIKDGSAGEAELDTAEAEDSASTDGDRGARNGETGPQSESEPEAETDPEPEGVRVEYLNYEVLADHGWSLDDDDLFEKAAEADLDPGDRGRFRVEERQSLLQAAEECGFAWPYACRGGACANCAVAITEGELETPIGHILSSEMTDRGIELSCIGIPATDELKVVYNLKHLPELDELRLPPSRFEKAQLND
ncbi:ferredoxin Fer [Salinigranum sp. GCM10025319]|uniref:ferredoxin Fer n=1 Tax=Salinigranum sp. GCM10025319 TaxID=3252687 RepID=UPI0036069622